MTLPPFERYYGVDFSGAKKAGDNLWVAEVHPRTTRRGPSLELHALDRMTALCGTADRAPVLGHLVRLIAASEAALWGCDFPFGLPLELFPAGTTWPEHFTFLGEWGEEAYDCGLECVRRAMALFQRKHIRRATDGEAKAPFDAFHYRMIYQTFYGMRDVIGPLREVRGTAILPFHYRRLRTSRRVLVECCPGSVLKRVGAPHQNYKQPAGGPLTRRRRLTRHAILDWLAGEVRFDERFRRVMMRNPGGDAIDAVIAAVGAARAVAAADHRAIARHPRYRREGHLYV
jgi:hypothetical protein